MATLRALQIPDRQSETKRRWPYRTVVLISVLISRVFGGVHVFDVLVIKTIEISELFETIIPSNTSTTIMP
jgi:hypothetical protein